MQDLRDACRALRATPVVTAVAVLSLALGIGANTAIFSILDSLLLKALPVKDPHELALVTIGPTRLSWTDPQWEQLRRHEQLFGGAFVWSSTRFNLAQGGQAEPVDGLWASGRYFEVLGVQPLLGRTLNTEDDRRRGAVTHETPGANVKLQGRSALNSWSLEFWRSAFEAGVVNARTSSSAP